MNKILYIGIILTLLFSVGCSQEEVGTGREEGVVVQNFRLCSEPVQIVVSSDKEGESRLSTRAEVENDALINNLTVLQFDWDQGTEGNEDANAVCVTSRYLRAPEPKEGTDDVYSIGLRAKDKQTQYLIFIANAGSVFQQYEGKTLADFRKETVSLNQKTTSGDNVLMIGAVRVPVTETENVTPHSLTLKRLVARIHFSWQAKPTVTNTTFTPSVLQLKNVPKTLVYIDGAEGASSDYPEKTAENFRDYTSIVDRIEEGFTWYIPLNRRSGKGSATSIWEKNGENAPDDFCTYIELAGVYRTPNMPDQLATYRFYVGGNLTDNYNVYQNHDYEVKAEITGVNTFDKRVTSKNFSYSENANSFLVAPEEGNVLSFSPYNVPGVDVKGTGIVYKDQLIEGRYSKISDVKLIWQTSNDLITVSHGQGMVSVTPNTAGTSGNALIGAYDEAGNILWSWHIWVTPYAGIVNDNETSPMIGSRQTYNNQEWMDRNLGALDLLTAAVPELMFQWGRKDPFLKDDMYTSDGNVFSFSTLLSPIDPITSSVKAPTTFYTVSSAGSWYANTELSEGLWQDNVKTVFDPCPHGWRIPQNGSWNGFVQNKNFFTWRGDRYSVYRMEEGGNAIYRLGGYLSFSAGTWDGKSSYGSLWSSTASDGIADAYCFYYESRPASGNESNGIVQTNRLLGRGYGISIRCVKIK